MFLSSMNEIEVFQRCLACGGIEFVEGVVGKTERCAICNGKGETSERVRLGDLLRFLTDEQGHQYRLQGGR